MSSARTSMTSIIRPALQLAAFGVGIGVIVWTVRVALKPDNQHVLRQLRDAPWQYPALLGLLCLATVLVNGAAFWVQLLPVRRLRLTDVIAVNAIASILSYLPFKISLLFRFLIHTRRDGMSVLSIGAWFLSVGAVMAVVLIPLAAAGAWRQTPDGVWLAASVLSVSLAAGLMLAVCRLLAREPAWAWFSRLVVRLPMPARARAIVEKPGGLMDRAHEGVRMLAHTWAVLGGIGLRLIDVSIHAARYYLAAQALGVPMGIDQAVLAGSVYFIIGVVAPAGQIGVREGGTAGLLRAILPGVSLDSLLIIGLLLSVTEMLVTIGASIPAWAVLRPDRLMQRRGQAGSRGAEAAK